MLSHSSETNIKQVDADIFKNFLPFPIEITFQILSFLKPEELLKLCTVSKSVNILASDNFLWKPFLRPEHEVAEFTLSIKQTLKKDRILGRSEYLLFSFFPKKNKTKISSDDETFDESLSLFFPQKNGA